MTVAVRNGTGTRASPIGKVSLRCHIPICLLHIISATNVC